MKSGRSIGVIVGWVFLVSSLWLAYGGTFPTTSTPAPKATVSQEPKAETPAPAPEPEKAPEGNSEETPPVTDASITPTTATLDPSAKVPAGTPRPMPKTINLAAVKSMFSQLVTTYPDVVSYNRDDFKHWVDADRNGCDTRAEVLKIESTKKTTIKAGSKCTISTGSWYSLYEGKTLTAASGIDIDHMIPLKEAALSGAYHWSAASRQAFANDLGYPGSLIAVSASTNRSKSDQDPASWMPTSTSYQCTYIATWTAVKWRWQLTIDPSEKTKISSILGSCKDSDLKLPTK